MAEETGAEKSLPASPRKIQRAREEGNVPKSQDLNSGISLLVALGGLYLFGPTMFDLLIDSGRFFIGNLDTLVPSQTPIQVLTFQVLYVLGWTVLPFALVMTLAGVASSLAQVGPLFTTKAIQPKLNRLNPITGLQRFVSVRALVEFLKSMAKLLIIGVIVWYTVRERMEEMLVLMEYTPMSLLGPVSAMIVAVWWRIAVAMIAIGLIDYAYQRWQTMRDLRMTAQEAKQEAKELEGDPQIKRRVRQLQREMATRRMMGDVPEADVVVTNPTHYAVALRYDAANMQSPVVTAKGARLLAQRIREIATEHAVPVVQRPELARTLYQHVEIGQDVPEDLFRVTAEVLAFVYRIDQRAEKVKERRMAGAA